ncbi:hypothetical protein T06_2674 [Trichinella sp. T6]|nr:hypothetical protein T06_2674 [Trichinella sp. T6]
MATRRDRGSEDESAKSNSGGRTGADVEADPAAAPGGTLHTDYQKDPQKPSVRIIGIALAEPCLYVVLMQYKSAVSVAQSVSAFGC